MTINISISSTGVAIKRSGMWLLLSISLKAGLSCLVQSKACPDADPDESTLEFDFCTVLTAERILSSPVV